MCLASHCVTQSSRLPGATQLAVVILDIAAIAEVVQAGVFRLAIFLLAGGVERVAIHLNVGAGL